MSNTEKTITVEKGDNRQQLTVPEFEKLIQMKYSAELLFETPALREKVQKNAYCFGYILANDVKTPYTIDAQDIGSIARFINHSETPNLISTLATIDFINHILLITNEPISKGQQLCYNYGEAYWSQRGKKNLN